MRLTRNSAIFLALLLVVIVVAYIFLQDDSDEAGTETTVEATAETIQLFASVDVTTITNLIVSEQRELGDTRPTPMPGEATLVPPTPLPDDAEPEITQEIVNLVKDSETGAWTPADDTSLAIDGDINSEQVDNAIRSLISLRSNNQFTPEDGDYSQFGLDNPTFEVVFNTNTDESYRLRIGDRTISENSYYAFLNDDDETIYIVTNASTLQSNILNLTTTVPLIPTAVPTAVPALNVTAPFAEFILTNAVSFSFTERDGTQIEVTRSADNTQWIYTENGEELPVQQESLQVILNNFSVISGVEQVETDDLASLGLDAPQYTLIARTFEGREYTLQLGDTDPTNSFYYALVDDFTNVALIDSDSVLGLLDLFENQPPLLEIETTPEATEPAAEVTESADSD